MEKQMNKSMKDYFDSVVDRYVIGDERNPFIQPFRDFSTEIDTTSDLPNTEEEARQKRLEEFMARRETPQQEMIDPVRKELQFEALQKAAPVADKLKEKGFTNETVAGILGNIDVETGGSFAYDQQQKGGKGYGLFQLDFQKPFYEKFLEESGLEDNGSSQIDYMFETIYGNQQDVIGRGNAAKLREAFATETDPKEISKIFMELWEKPGVPHLDRRITSAENYYKLL